MSRSIEHLFNHRCQITDRSVGNTDAYGGFDVTEATPVSTVGRVVSISLREREALNRQGVDADYAIYLEPGTNVNRGDHILMLEGYPPTDEMVVQSIETPSEADLYRKVYASCEQRRFQVA